ncbi:MAG: hypothetical protein Q8P18_31050 [Pseudomonadota bacterium]|nr:hypothetical protein [Pseudomonadota bacterium]
MSRGPPPPRSSAPVERAVGIVLLGLVLWVYSGALERDRWPPGHPWSGLTLSLLGLSALLWPSPRWAEASPASRAARIVVAILALVGALLWFESARIATTVPHIGL